MKIVFAFAVFAVVFAGVAWWQAGRDAERDNSIASDIHDREF